MSSHTSGKQLSDRLMDTLEDSMAKMFATDYVQKILMTGEMSDENIRYAKVYWKRSKELALVAIELLKRAYSVATNEGDRKIVDQWVKTVPEELAAYYQRFEQKLGGIGSDVKIQAIDETMIDYTLMHNREMKRGSFVRMMVTQLVGNWHVLRVHQYLKRQPLYRPNPMVTYFLFTEFPIETYVSLLKNMIDSNGGQISPPEELELIQLAKETMDLDMKIHLNL
ncbi:unnamed protein product [Medioppia subpectinata]|uniref:Uncharacterized protein n=1 Tax=Medioppia subpectinata TaxID=1979941 RepID=A0A7R9L4J0_9ACAR|nr:unnamed protein product [Medioppia subpectinata]CAG2115200.1 unnamed protein product [Medioppia subpectinata]